MPCDGCRGGKKGFDMSDLGSVEVLGAIHVEQSCGCKGEIVHAAMRCRDCGKYYARTSIEHKKPVSYFDYTYLVEKNQAERLIKEWGGCDKISCHCAVHNKAEDLNLLERFGKKSVHRSSLKEKGAGS